MITEKEASFYVRITLKQWGLHDMPFVWTDTRQTLGAYDLILKRIELSRRILNSFALFEEVFLHELAHALDMKERNHVFLKNGRCSFHNKTWKQWCAKLGIPARTSIPVHLFFIK